MIFMLVNFAQDHLRKEMEEEKLKMKRLKEIEEEELKKKLEGSGSGFSVIFLLSIWSLMKNNIFD